MKRLHLQNSFRILVVDDEPGVRALLRDTFTQAGYEVVEANNGYIAVQLHIADPVDLVITDLLMPQQEGFETIAEFRRRFPEVQIIAVSGALRGPVLQMAACLGASAVFAKPFDTDQVLAAANGLLGN